MDLVSWIASLIGVVLLADSIRAWRRSARMRAEQAADGDVDEGDPDMKRMAG